MSPEIEREISFVVVVEIWFGLAPGLDDCAIGLSRLIREFCWERSVASLYDGGENENRSSSGV